MELTVNKNDIRNIGTTSFNDNGFYCIICESNTANIEEILLRSILLCFGDYKIVETSDCNLNDDDNDIFIEFKTNLPWDMVEEALESQTD